MHHYRPINHLGPCQLDGTAQLGESGKQQIRTHGEVRFDIKEENQNRRHERATPHTGEAHDHTNKKPCKYKSQIMHGLNCKVHSIY